MQTTTITILFLIILSVSTLDCDQKVKTTLTISSLLSDDSIMKGEGTYGKTVSVYVSKRMHLKNLRISKESTEGFMKMAIKIMEKTEDFDMQDFEDEITAQDNIGKDGYFQATPKIYFCGKANEDGKDYFLIGMQEGKQNLSHMLEKSVDGCLISFERKFDLMYQMANSVLSVHSAGYGHCDLKFENFIEMDNGEVSVIDFGLSERDHACRASTPYTAGPEMIDLPSHYRNNAFNRFSTDIYALGILFSHMFVDCDSPILNYNTNYYKRTEGANLAPSELVEYSFDEFKKAMDTLSSFTIDMASQNAMRKYLLRLFRPLALEMVNADYRKRPNISKVVAKLKIIRRLLINANYFKEFDYFKTDKNLKDLADEFELNFHNKRARANKEDLPIEKNEMIRHLLKNKLSKEITVERDAVSLKPKNRNLKNQFSKEITIERDAVSLKPKDHKGKLFV